MEDGRDQQSNAMTTTTATDPATADASTLRYMSGFGNDFSSEAVHDSLPRGRNSPQHPPFNLYPELISGTAFMAARATNRRTWTYRRQPAVVTGAYQPYGRQWSEESRSSDVIAPNPLRWKPFALPVEPTDFLDGIRPLVSCGSPDAQAGISVHVYLANTSMDRRAFVNADGEMLVVPQYGRVIIATELGVLEINPGEVALVPRGIAFKVSLPDGPSRGYVCENYGALFRLPELGPLGSNGLANGRDFLAPIAWFETSRGEYEVVKKSSGRLWHAALGYSPFNVVAWHGNLVPWKYDTANFMAIGSISHDHPDPSIFTVLTSPSDSPGMANCDFLIFPPRWLVAEDTFRPPWYHRNIMSEFMGLIRGRHDAKPSGFEPGGASLHNSMVPHGPDLEAFERATNEELKPQKLENTLAFMFESRYRLAPTQFALSTEALVPDYSACWEGLQDRFRVSR
jgi:homogentisate 1,2-dioxygenase